MPLTSRIADALTALFDKSDELALTTGFIKRRRKITGSNFIKTLLFAWMQKEPPSVEGISQAGFTHHLHISAQGIDQRFNDENACHFLKASVEHFLKEKISAEQQVDINILNRFTSVYVADTSTIVLPNELESHYKGTGGKSNSNKAALKLDVCFELKSGQLECGLLNGKDSDSRTPIAEKDDGKGSLRLQDLGYFNLTRMKKQHEHGAYWVSRLQPNTVILDENNQEIDLNDYLQNTPQTSRLFELNVFVGKTKKLPARLMICKLPQEAASRRREKMKENAKKQGRSPTDKNLALCDWNFYITNVEKERLSPQECLVLYRVRWQIELLFKLWKTHNKIDKSRSKNPYRVLCEIYIKLLVVIIQHWVLLTGLWGIPERSLVKATQLIKEHSTRFAEAVEDKDKLIAFLEEMSERFQSGCSLNKRKRKPNTVDILENPHENYVGS